jgi:hypothetical protein
VCIAVVQVEQRVPDFPAAVVGRPAEHADVHDQAAVDPAGPRDTRVGAADDVRPARSDPFGVLGPRLGTGPDRDWLFRGHAYNGTLQEHLSRLPAG